MPCGSSQDYPRKEISPEHSLTGLEHLHAKPDPAARPKQEILHRRQEGAMRNEPPKNPDTVVEKQQQRTAPERAGQKYQLSPHIGAHLTETAVSSGCLSVSFPPFLLYIPDFSPFPPNLLPLLPAAAGSHEALFPQWSASPGWFPEEPGFHQKTAHPSHR